MCSPTTPPRSRTRRRTHRLTRARPSQHGAERRKGIHMADEKKRKLTADELAEQGGEELPERDEMSLVNLNAAIPVNAAIAANVLSDGSVADAGALQQTP